MHIKKGPKGDHHFGEHLTVMTKFPLCVILNECATHFLEVLLPWSFWCDFQHPFCLDIRLKAFLRLTLIKTKPSSDQYCLNTYCVCSLN